MKKQEKKPNKEQTQEKQNPKRITGRTFDLAIHKDKDGNEITTEKLKEIFSKYVGMYEMYGIKHDRDKTKSTHHHILLHTKTPRDITTIANIFNVAPNMVEKTQNFQGMLRYLTHIDNPDKEKYEPEEVFTNTNKNYKDLISKGTLTNKEIYEDLITNGAEAIFKYIDIIEPYRLRTLQTLAQDKRFQKLESEIVEMKNGIYDTYNLIKSAKDEFNNMLEMMRDKIAPQFVMLMENFSKTITEPLYKIAEIRDKTRR